MKEVCAGIILKMELRAGVRRGGLRLSTIDPQLFFQDHGRFESGPSTVSSTSDAAGSGPGNQGKSLAGLSRDMPR